MTKTHLWTLFVVLLLSGYLLYDFQSEKQNTERKASDAQLISLKPDQINEFSIEKGESQITLQRTIDGWKIVVPFEDEADDFYVDDFVKRMTDEKIVGVAKEGESIDWKVYGLEEGRGTISLKSQSDKEMALEISEKKNFEQNGYARMKGQNRALVVTSAWMSHLDKKPDDFRDKRILRAKIADVKALKIEIGSEQFELERNDNTWTVRDRPTVKLDQNRVRELLSMINETQATEFVAWGSETKTSLKKNMFPKDPLVRIDAKLGDERTWNIQWWRSTDKEMALISQPQAILSFAPGTLAKFLNISLDGLRDKREPFDVKLDSVSKIEWVTPVKTTILQKEKDTWGFEKNELENPDPDLIQNFLKELSEAKVYKYATARESKAFKPTSFLRIFGLKDEIVLSIEWETEQKGKESNVTRLVKTNLSKDIFHLEESELQTWSPHGLLKKSEVEKK